MSMPDWLQKMMGALAEPAGAGGGGTPPGSGQGSGQEGAGQGQFAERLGGVTLRQYATGGLGGSTERVLAFHPGGQFVYHETSQYDGGFVRTDPEYGFWSASGDFPRGQVSLSWASGGITQHVIEYHGGDTCLFDGVATRVG